MLLTNLRAAVYLIDHELRVKEYSDALDSATAGELESFDEPDIPQLLEQQLAAATSHEGVYAYETRQGPRWRYVFRDADGRLTSRRGRIIAGATSAGIASRRRSRPGSR